MCCNFSGLLAGDVKESRNGNPTRDLQMAADRTRPRSKGYLAVTYWQAQQEAPSLLHFCVQFYWVHYNPVLWPHAAFWPTRN
jgi:hypothetical protein